MKRIIQNFLCLLMSLLFVFVTAGCIISPSDSSSDSDTEEDAEEDDEEEEESEDSDDETIDYEVSDTTVLYVNLTDGEWSADNSTFTDITTDKRWCLTGVYIRYTKDSDGNNTGKIFINASAAENSITYNFTGTMTTGGVKIKTNKSVDDAAKVNLNGVSIKSSNYPCLAISNGASAVVNLTGTNTFEDGRKYGTGYGSEYSTSSSDTYTVDGVKKSCTVVSSAQRNGSDSKGTLFCKGNLTLEGSGSLIITTAYKNCIAAGTDSSTASLTINNGTYNLTSTGKSGLNAYNVTINGGSYTFSGTGTISYSNSTYVFHKTHGITSDGAVVINDGTINLTAYNGKGITGGTVTIAGGNIVVSSSGVTGFTKDDNRKGSYYDADGVLYEDEYGYTTVAIVFAAEGIEGATDITISGGTVEVAATNDALNMSSETEGCITISGGSIYAYSSGGDAVDSNRDIIIKGGTIMTCAPNSQEDGLDCGEKGYSITITGGLIASCSGATNVKTPTMSNQKALGLGVKADSTPGAGGQGQQGQGQQGPGSGGGFGGRAVSTLSSTSSSYSSSYAGTTIIVLDSSQNIVYALTVPSSSSNSSGNGMGGGESSGISSVIMTSPKFSTSGSYTVYTGATVTGGTSFHGLYTTLPTVSSTGTEQTSVTSY